LGNCADFFFLSLTARLFLFRFFVWGHFFFFVFFFFSFSVRFFCFRFSPLQLGNRADFFFFVFSFSYCSVFLHTNKIRILPITSFEPRTFRSYIIIAILHWRLIHSLIFM
jgi:hypothetical protein